MFKTDLARKNWEAKYQYNDETPVETQRRIAKAVASVEKNPEEWEEKFYNVLVKTDSNGNPVGLKNTFGGRITANLGTTYKGTTLINCFVNGPVNSAKVRYERTIPGAGTNIPVEIDTQETPDSLANIMLTLLEQAETLKSEGGYGINFGFIRPRGTPIKSIGIKHPGVVHYMRIWDVVASVIVMGDNDGYRDDVKNYLDEIGDKVVEGMKKQARKGAQMAVLPIWHPDVEEFIRAKSEKEKLTKFNISVLIDDAFMNAVINDDFYDLHFNGKIYKRVKAKELYEVIVKSSHNRNEPGVLFYDSMQRNNPLSYLGEVTACNPCLPKNMWIMTSNGARKVEELLDNNYTAVVNGKEYGASNFFRTTFAEITEIELSNGMKFSATANHPVKIVTNQTSSLQDTSWIEVENLRIGDNVLLNNHRGIKWGNESEYAEGWLMGILIGDGNIQEDHANLDFWGSTSEYMKDHAINLLLNSKTIKVKNKMSGCNNGKRIRVKSAGLQKYANSLGVYGGNKIITDDIEKMSSSFYEGFLQGYFDADGTVLDNLDSGKGLSVRLYSHDLSNLESVQRMLLRLGIVSSIYKNRKEAGNKNLPDGHGGVKEYKVRAGHELVISKDNILFFKDRIGFHDLEKQNTLNSAIDKFTKNMDRERFSYPIKEIRYAGNVDVYDCTVDDIHEFDANGCSLHNCGEVPGNAATSTVCLLGSVNITQYVNLDRTFDWEQYKQDIAVFARMLDNINDLTDASLPQYKWAIQNIRQYGMGIGGLGSALYMMGVPYNSQEALDFIEQVTWWKEEITWKTSALLANEKGVFPAYCEKFLQTNWFNEFTNISEETKDLIRQYGVRNGKTTTNPPLGNTSIICDNVTNGIEPVFSQRYMRTYIVGEWPEGLSKYNIKKFLQPVTQGDATVWEGNIGGKHYLYEPHNRGLCVVEEVMDYGYRWVSEHYPNDINNKESYLISAQELTIEEHMQAQAVVQRNCNQAVSKTCNLPESYSFDDYKDLYVRAWKLGLNGFTTYREGSMEAVLSTVEKNNGTREIIKKDIKLPDIFTNGAMHVFKREGMKFYMHFSYLPEDVNQIFPVAIWIHTNAFGEIREGNAAVRSLIGLLEKFEIDKNLIEAQKEKIKGNPGHERLAKMISMCLRHNIPIVNIVHVLDQIEDVYVTDTLYAVKKFLSTNIEEGTPVIGAKCASCKSSNIVYAGGCSLCQDCGASGCE